MPEDATLVVYMPGRDLGRIARELRDAGVAEGEACCAISHAATPRQSWVAARLDGLDGMECGSAPVLLLVGRAMAGLLVGANDAAGAMQYAIAEALVRAGKDVEEG